MNVRSHVSKSYDIMTANKSNKLKLSDYSDISYNGLNTVDKLAFQNGKNMKIM